MNDVVIIGAGPAGLATAVTLARYGVASTVLDRRTAPSALPRATSVSVRSMELLRAWGLEEEVRAGGVEVEWTAWVCRTLADAAGGGPTPTGYPTRAQAAVVSPVAPACVPQDHLEPVLLRALARSGLADVRFGTAVTDVAHDLDGVRTTLAGGDVLRSRFLVAADGTRSAVRTALGIGLVGSDDLAQAATTLFRAPLWALLGDRRHGLYDVSTPDGAGVFLPAGRGDRWLYGTLSEGPGDLAARIRAGAGVPGLPLRQGPTATFTFGAQVAERFREDGVFLTGDAAHRVTPRGGTGINLALQDGADLGWKLAWVLRGWAGDGLLDRYETERRPHAEHNAARSADPAGTARPAETELRADLGGRLAHVWTDRGSTLDLLGPGLTLFTGPAPTGWAAAAAEARMPVPLEVARLDALSARALGIPDGGALLARPDGVPAGWWPDDAAPAAALDGAVGALVGAAARV